MTKLPLLAVASPLTKRAAMTILKALVPVLLCAVAVACGERSLPTDVPGPAFSYGSPGCFPGFTATQVCQFFEGPAATATSYCMYGDCFEMNYGTAVRVVAADEQGEYPNTWFAWGDGVLVPWAATEPCWLTQEGKNKTRLEIPEGHLRCMASVTIGPDTYYEHFASSPPTQCLGWLECKVPAVPAP